MTDFLDSFIGGDFGPNYPGSKMKRQVREVIPEYEEEIEWPKGRMLTIQGVEVQCFTTGELAWLLGGRKAVTIRSWESAGILPKSGYYVPGKGGDVRGRRRYYTQAQCQAVLDIAAEEGVLYPSTRTSITKTNFASRVTAKFIEMRKQGIR
jgi:hypothetical protein